MEEFGAAQVGFHCYEKGYFEKCLRHYLRHSVVITLTLTLPLTHTNFVW